MLTDGSLTSPGKSCLGFNPSEVTNIEIVRPCTTSRQHSKKDKVDFEGDHFDPMFAVDNDFPAFDESDEEESSGKICHIYHDWGI